MYGCDNVLRDQNDYNRKFLVIRDAVKFKQQNAEFFGFLNLPHLSRASVLSPNRRF